MKLKDGYQWVDWKKVNMSQWYTKVFYTNSYIDYRVTFKLLAKTLYLGNQ